MNEINGGSSRAKVPYARGSTYTRSGSKSGSPVYDPKDEASVEDLQSINKKIVKKQELAKSESKSSSTRIMVKQGIAIKQVVPSSVWRCAPFKWDPLPFSVENEKLNDRIIEAEVQNQGLSMFLDDVRIPIVYGVSGNPDDVQARYFAAFLVDAHLQALGSKANVVWHTLYGGFDNPLLKSHTDNDLIEKPSLLVLTNLSPASTGVKLDKAKDLLEKFQDIPRIVVMAGEDPLSFLSCRLYSEVNALAYFCQSLVKRKMDII